MVVATLSVLLASGRTLAFFSVHDGFPTDQRVTAVHTAARHWGLTVTLAFFFPIFVLCFCEKMYYLLRDYPRPRIAKGADAVVE